MPSLLFLTRKDLRFSSTWRHFLEDQVRLTVSSLSLLHPYPFFIITALLIFHFHFSLSLSLSLFLSSSSPFNFIPTYTFPSSFLGSLDEFLRAYVNKFKFSTVTSVEWKDFFLQFFDKEVCAYTYSSYVQCIMNYSHTTCTPVTLG